MAFAADKSGELGSLADGIHLAMSTGSTLL